MLCAPWLVCERMHQRNRYTFSIGMGQLISLASPHTFCVCSTAQILPAASIKKSVQLGKSFQNNQKQNDSPFANSPLITSDRYNHFLCVRTRVMHPQLLRVLNWCPLGSTGSKVSFGDVNVSLRWEGGYDLSVNMIMKLETQSDGNT